MEDKVDQVAIQMEMVDAMEDDIKRGTGKEDEKNGNIKDDGAEVKLFKTSTKNPGCHYGETKADDGNEGE